MSDLDLGLIGNSRTSALIDRQARIAWWCYPHFDSNPMCCSLLCSDVQNGSPDAFGFIDVIFPSSHTVRVGEGRDSAADYVIPDHQAIVPLLDLLIDYLPGRRRHSHSPHNLT